MRMLMEGGQGRAPGAEESCTARQSDSQVVRCQAHNGNAISSAGKSAFLRVRSQLLHLGGSQSPNNDPRAQAMSCEMLQAQGCPPAGPAGRCRKGARHLPRKEKNLPATAKAGWHRARGCSPAAFAAADFSAATSASYSSSHVGSMCSARHARPPDGQHTQVPSQHKALSCVRARIDFLRARSHLLQKGGPAARYSAMRGGIGRGVGDLQPSQPQAPRHIRPPTN